MAAHKHKTAPRLRAKPATNTKPKPDVSTVAFPDPDAPPAITGTIDAVIDLTELGIVGPKAERVDVPAGFITATSEMLVVGLQPDDEHVKVAAWKRHTSRSERLRQLR